MSCVRTILFDVMFGISNFPYIVDINHRLRLTSPNMSHEPGRPNSVHQEPVGSKTECITIVPNNTFPKSNPQETSGSTYDRLALVLNNIRHICTQNSITALFINNTKKTDIREKYNGLHQKYVDIPENK